MSRSVIVWHVITSSPLSAWHHLSSLNDVTNKLWIKRVVIKTWLLFLILLSCFIVFMVREVRDRNTFTFHSIIQDSNVALRALSEACFSKNWFTAAQARATSQLNHLNPNSEPQLTFLWPHKPIPNLSPDTGLWLAETDHVTWILASDWSAYMSLDNQPSPGVSRWSQDLLDSINPGETLVTACWHQHLTGTEWGWQMMPQIAYLFTTLFLSSWPRSIWIRGILHATTLYHVGL